MEYYKLNSDFYLIEVPTQEEKEAILKVGGISIEDDSSLLIKSAAFEKSFLVKVAEPPTDDFTAEDEEFNKEFYDEGGSERDYFIKFLKSNHTFIAQDGDNFVEYEVEFDDGEEGNSKKIELPPEAKIYTDGDASLLTADESDRTRYVTLSKVSERNQKSNTNKFKISIDNFKKNLETNPEVIEEYKAAKANARDEAWEEEGNKDKARLEKDMASIEKSMKKFNEENATKKTLEEDVSPYGADYNIEGEDEELTPEERQIVDQRIKQKDLEFRNVKNLDSVGPTEEEIYKEEQREVPEGLTPEISEKARKFKEWKERKNRNTSSDDKLVDEILKNADLAEIYVKIAERKDVTTKNLDSIIEEEILSYLTSKF